MCVSTRTPGPPGGWYAVMSPGEGWKLRAGSSAFTRHSMACPRRRWPFRTNDSGSPAATRICSFTRSKFVHISVTRSEEHTSELQSHSDLVCRLLLEKKKKKKKSKLQRTQS